MDKLPALLLIGDGRLARHLTHYFGQLGVRHDRWSRRLHAAHACPDLASLVRPGTHVLLAISDAAIEPFILTQPSLRPARWVHFSGSLTTDLATAAHPLCSFAATLYDRDLYQQIPFVLDRGSPALETLIPGVPNPAFFIDRARRPLYHALCVLAGNFTTLLWSKFFFELETTFGIPRDQAMPYLESIAGGLLGQGAPLSGPLSRGDRQTIERNLEALEGDPFAIVYRAFLEAYEQQQRHGGGDGPDWLRSRA